MRRPAALLATFSLFASGCTAPSGAPELSVPAELVRISADVDRAVSELVETLDQIYDNETQLYQRLIDLRLPATLAILHDKAQRVTALDGTDPEAERYVRFVGELVLTSEAIDLAIATDDPAAVAIAAIRMEASIGALAVTLSQASCLALTPDLGRDLCDPGRLSGYEKDLNYEIRRFVASFRPVLRVPPGVGPTIQGEVLGSLQTEALLVLDSAADRIGALDSGTTYAGIQQILLDYFSVTEDALSTYQPGAAEGAGAITYDEVIEGLDAVRTTTWELLEEQYETVTAARSNTKIDWITDIWFEIPPAAS